MRFTATPSLSLYYELHGEGPPLLLLHGFTGGLANWAPVIARLQSGHRLITLDLPGHGRSDAPPDPAAYAMPAVSRHVAALLDHLGYEDVHLLGYSMGGRLALYLALHYPQRWRSLVLESASPGLATAAERHSRIAADNTLADFIEQHGIEAFVDRWEALPLFTSQEKLPDATQEAHRALRLQNSPQGLANSLRGMGAGAQPSLWQRLDELVLPTLLIAGSLDHKFVNIARQMAQHVTHAQLQIVPDAGHTVHLERPALYTQLLLNWLRETGNGSPTA